MALPIISDDEGLAQPRHTVGQATNTNAELFPTYLTPQELAARWRISPRTLERWRRVKTGPNFHKISGKVTYSIIDIETYERHRRAETHVDVLVGVRR